MDAPVAAVTGPDGIDVQPPPVSTVGFGHQRHYKDLTLARIPSEFKASVMEHLPDPLPEDEAEREQLLRKALRDSGVEQYARYQGIWPLNADIDQRDQSGSHAREFQEHGLSHAASGGNSRAQAESRGLCSTVPRLGKHKNKAKDYILHHFNAYLRVLTMTHMRKATLGMTCRCKSSNRMI